MSFEERREQVKALGLDDAKAHTKSTLKGIFRVKPAKDAEPCSSYKNDYKKMVNLYHLNQCTPMRALPQKPRSKAQKAATEKLVRANAENSSKGRAIKLCKSLIEDRAVVIDTETTDLNGVVIEISAVCCATREVLYSSKVYTDKPISKEAFELHGISSDMLTDAPKPDEVYRELKRVCEGRRVVAFNAEFDFYACKRTFQTYSRDGKTVSEFFAMVRERKVSDKACELLGGSHERWVCVMYDIAAPILGSTNRYGSISLARATELAKVRWEGEAHSSVADALATVDLIRALAVYEP
jgi:DNA polymerase III epsilon subunit-like protein